MGSPYKVEVARQVRKFLDKRNKDFTRKVLQRFKILAMSPYKSSLDIKVLKGQKNLWRLRIGSYRFIYNLKKDDKVILFLKADSRGKVYKK